MRPNSFKRKVCSGFFGHFVCLLTAKPNGQRNFFFRLGSLEEFLFRVGQFDCEFVLKVVGVLLCRSGVQLFFKRGRTNVEEKHRFAAYFFTGYIYLFWGSTAEAIIFTWGFETLPPPPVSLLQ